MGTAAEICTLPNTYDVEFRAPKKNGRGLVIITVRAESEDAAYAEARAILEKLDCVQVSLVTTGGVL